jgi:hypothetical protein
MYSAIPGAWVWRQTSAKQAHGSRYLALTFVTGPAGLVLTSAFLDSQLKAPIRAPAFVPTRSCLDSNQLRAAF